MSRYIVRDDQLFKVVVGWDSPLRTFFVQVHDQTEPDEEKRIILWEGTRPRELDQPRDVKRRVLPWVTLSHEQLVELRDDKLSNN